MLKKLAKTVAEVGEAVLFPMVVVSHLIGSSIKAEYEDWAKRRRILREVSSEQAKLLKRLGRSKTDEDFLVNKFHCEQAGVKLDTILLFTEPHPLAEVFSLHDSW